ncbi:MAG: hypothetical protein GW949_07710 [Spirochaetales bacterium]|nr:hypothetical protein [Spirochaetales bacterium]
MVRNLFSAWVLILLGIFTVLSLSAQEDAALELQDLDFSQARLSFAGPAAFLLRDARIGDDRLGFLLRLNDEGRWKIAEIITATNGDLPSNLILDFARFEVTDDGTLAIDGILWDGEPYATEITIAQDSTLGLPGFLDTGSFVGASLARALDDADLYPGTEYREVVLERDQVVAEMSQLGETLNTQISELVGERTRLVRELSEAKGALDQLQEQNDFLASELQTLREAVAPVEEINPEVTTEKTTALEERVKNLEEEVQQMNQRIVELETAQEVTRVEADTRGEGPEISADVDLLLNQIRELQQANALMVQEKVLIENELRRTFAWEGYLAVVGDEFAQERHTGFTGASSAMGSWAQSEDGKRIAQTDPTQYFARLDLPVVQQNEALLYQVTARATGEGWAGLGFHIYADKSVRQRGYGFGESLLIWLTRDPEVHGTETTYLELYRSRDDVNMERVLHAAIEESLAQDLHIEVLYEPVQDFITLRVNGEEKIRYKTWFQIDSGVQVALRSLGTAVFSDLTIRSR